MSEQVKKYIAEYILKKPDTQAKTILDLVNDKFHDTGINIPKLRTVQALVKQLKEEVGQNYEEQPWSLATMDQAKIGWEAASFLLMADGDLRRLQSEGKHLPWQNSAAPYIFKGTLEKVVQAEMAGKKVEREYIGPPVKPRTILTNRQAKWLWRIHLIVPGLELADLYPHVEPYAHREILAYYLREPFDTTDLDSALMNILLDIKRRGYYPNRNTSNIRTKTKKNKRLA